MNERVIAILPNELLGKSEEKRPFLRLPHPQSYGPALFLLAKGKFYELNAVSPNGQQADQTWFIQNNPQTAESNLEPAKSSKEYIQPNPKLYILTVFDPFWLLVSLLHLLHETKQSTNFTTPEELWDRINWAITNHTTHDEPAKRPREDEEEVERVDYSVGVLKFGEFSKNLLEKCCDVLNQGGVNMYRYNEQLALEKIIMKMDNLLTRLFTEDTATSYRKKIARSTREIIQVLETTRPTATTTTINKDELEKSVIKELQIQYTFELLANYLPPLLSEQLKSKYPLPIITEYTTALSAAFEAKSQLLSSTYLPGRKSTTDKEPKEKKAATAGIKGRKSRGAKSLETASTRGMKSLKSLFGAPASAVNTQPTSKSFGLGIV